jgi:hypothetical protein
MYPVPSIGISVNPITNDPVLVGMHNPHIASNSFCVNAGSNDFALGVDIDGEPRMVDGTVDIGCDEVVPAGLTGALAAAIYAPYPIAVVNAAVPFYADVRGKAALLEWAIATNGGMRVINNAGAVQQAWPAPGVFPVILRAWNNDGMAAATVMVQVVSAVTNYAAHGGAHLAPFMTLAHAATSIVAALEAVPPGGVTVVSNGVYADGTIMLDRDVTLTSLAGRDYTVIDGQGVRRCVFMSHAGAVVQALTIGNGFLNTDNGAGVFAAAGTIDRCALEQPRVQRECGVAAAGRGHNRFVHLRQCRHAQFQPRGRGVLRRRRARDWVRDHQQQCQRIIGRRRRAGVQLRRHGRVLPRGGQSR